MTQHSLCNPSVRNCLRCTLPSKCCAGGSHSGKNGKFAKITSDESQAVKQQRLTQNCNTVDMVLDAI